MRLQCSTLQHTTVQQEHGTACATKRQRNRVGRPAAAEPRSAKCTGLSFPFFSMEHESSRGGQGGVPHESGRIRNYRVLHLQKSCRLFLPTGSSRKPHLSSVRPHHHFTAHLSIMKVGKPTSKRGTTRLRHKIEKASAAKQRKDKKLAKKVGNSLYISSSWSRPCTLADVFILLHTEPRMALQDQEGSWYPKPVPLQGQDARGN